MHQDGSYHQHGPQLYSGWGYGAIWTGQMLFFGEMADRTVWGYGAAADKGIN